MAFLELSLNTSFFLSLSLSKQIEIVIVDDEDYEKKETFQVYLGQPYVVTEEGEEPPPSPLGSTAEEERIRELGKPRLGMSKVYMVVEGKFGELQFIHLETQREHLLLYS